MQPTLNNIYLLHEEHAAFLEGEAGQLAGHRFSMREKRILGLLVLATAITGVIALVLSVISLRLTQTGSVTAARVIEHGTRLSLPGLTNYVVYAFTANGQTHTGQSGVTSAIYRQLIRRDASLMIAYLPDNPAISRLAGSHEIYTETSVSIFATLTGIGLCLLMFVRPYRIRRLARAGRLLPGEIKTSRRTRGITYVRFTFLSPEGRRLSGVASSERMTAAPKPGAPVAVLYLNENFYRML